MLERMESFVELWRFFFFSFFATRPVSTLIEVVFFLNEFSTKIKLQLTKIRQKKLERNRGKL